ncbi:hypothetical protein J2T18_004925 [Paenibacillus polymyxa]|uniref:hypothetical protein n=1 Tax=Paenibacillus polymyxa TaxID=1406 RepID=UPI002791E276|nr:hypothetical protein [Paenibacillus polymyxa]MDQ0050585.1 hypothetical protein [Paenibacillus polymyxa]
MTAQSLQYLQENNLIEYKQLAAMRTNVELKTATVDYAKTRTVFEGYKSAKYSRNYYSEHKADIELHRAARAAESCFN